MRDGVVDDVPPEILSALIREANFFSIDPLCLALQVWGCFLNCCTNDCLAIQARIDVQPSRTQELKNSAVLFPNLVQAG